jgi:hypothetical protein
VIRDEETGQASEGEVWLVGECGPGRSPEEAQLPQAR